MIGSCASNIGNPLWSLELIIVYLLPFFNRSLEKGVSIDCAGNILDEMLQDFGRAPADDYVSDICIFEVTKLRPEKRFRVAIPHMPDMTTCINVSLCCVVSRNPADKEQVIVFDDMDAHKSMDVCVLVGSMALSLRSCCRWKVSASFTEANCIIPARICGCP